MPQENIERERVPQAVELTAVQPFGLGYKTRYPLLAIRTKYTEAAQMRFGTPAGASRLSNSLFDMMQICAKDTYFLTAAQDGKFKWISSHHSHLYRPESADTYPREGGKRQTRYCIDDGNWEGSNVIYPVRQFSITSISLDGFDPSKGYPVLAIDTDKYLPEGEQDEAERPEGPQTETMAFFLVGNDTGEFVWVAEDECKLHPLGE